MSVQVTCPECGKEIVPEGAAEVRCTCIQSRPGFRTAQPSTEPSPSSDPTPQTTEKKVCWVCGKDLTGRKRLKDAVGQYWCSTCAKAEDRLKKRIEELRCDRCGRAVPAPKLIGYEGKMICGRCKQDIIEELEARVARVGIQRVHRHYEVGNIGWLLMMLVALGILALLHYFFGIFK